MHDTTEVALVEISLALAMAFFALLVVAVFSISAPAQNPGERDPAAHERAAIEVGADASAGATDRASTRRLVLHHQNRWFDERGRPAHPDQLASGASQLVVAVAPGLTVAQAQRLQTRLAAHQPIITTLTPEWIARLENTR